MGLRFLGRGLLLVPGCLYPVMQLMADQDMLILNDRKSGDLQSASDRQWHLVTDGVMGGVSDGRLAPGEMAGRPCLHLQGEVRLENNGGFIQATLDVPDTVLAGITGYTGVSLEVYGNGEQYNLHLRTRDLWLPWQSYRMTFRAAPQWQTLRLPFAGFEPYRTGRDLDVGRLKRIGIVAIGRAFNADLCIGKVSLYR